MTTTVHKLLDGEVQVVWRGRTYKVTVTWGHVTAVHVQLTPRQKPCKNPDARKGWRPLPLTGNVARSVSLIALDAGLNQGQS